MHDYLNSADLEVDIFRESVLLEHSVIESAQTLQDKCINKKLTNQNQLKFQLLTKDLFMNDDSIAFIYIEPECSTNNFILEVISFLNGKNKKKRRLVLFFFDDFNLAEAFRRGYKSPLELDNDAKAVFLHEENRESLKIKDPSTNKAINIFDYEIIGEDCLNQLKCSTLIYTNENFFNDADLFQLVNFVKKKAARKNLHLFFYNDLERTENKKKVMRQQDKNFAGEFYCDNSKELLRIRSTKTSSLWKTIFENREGCK